MADTGKVSKASVDYRLGGPHCHACIYFIEAASEKESEMGKNKCKKVAGDIGEHQLCDLFHRNTGMGILG